MYTVCNKCFEKMKIKNEGSKGEKEEGGLLFPE
jgi:hypothetical protein